MLHSRWEAPTDLQRPSYIGAYRFPKVGALRNQLRPTLTDVKGLEGFHS